jgi:hypothetical protein
MIPSLEKLYSLLQQVRHSSYTHTFTRQQVVHILLAYHGDEFLRSRHGETQGQEQRRTKEEL